MKIDKKIKINVNIWNKYDITLKQLIRTLIFFRIKKNNKSQNNKIFMLFNLYEREDFEYFYLSFNFSMQRNYNF